MGSNKRIMSMEQQIPMESIFEERSLDHSKHALATTESAMLMGLELKNGLDKGLKEIKERILVESKGTRGVLRRD